MEDNIYNIKKRKENKKKTFRNNQHWLILQ